MTRPARLLVSGVLAVVLALLAMPVVGSFLPAVQEVSREPVPVAEPAVPKQQLPPEVLSEPSIVTPLSAAAPLPAPGSLASLLEAELHVAGSGTFGGVVLDALTGATLWGSGEAEPVAPASNIKVLTAAAVLTHLPADARLRTSVLVSGDAVFLRGGGDVLLTAGDSRNDDDGVAGRAGLRTLAAETAAALTQEGGPYRVYLDDTFFAGAALDPTWAQGDVAAGETASVYPLAINSAWVDETGTGGPRFADAALAAAEIFSGELAAAASTRGIGISGPVERAPAPPEAAELAAAESATIGEQVQRMLHLSDNYLAEALARVAASASGRPASFGGATETLLATVQGLGVPVEGLSIGDTSGLSRQNTVTPAQLAGVLRVLATSDNPALGGVLQALPVAGLSGTLSERFTPATGKAAAGEGMVRAKTGTLNAVTALSGYVVTAEGRLLTFSFVATGLDGNTREARAAADSAATVLAVCGCR